MGEYWVSNAKYWCKFCKEWMADNKPSRSLHDNGKKHKDRVAAFHKEKRDAKLTGLQTDREVRQELQEIERAAKEAMAQDGASGAISFHPSSSSHPSFYPPPLPPHRSLPLLPLLPPPPSPVPTPYTVKGETYLPCTSDPSILQPSTPCQFFDDERDGWIDAVIATRNDTMVPNTNIVLTSYDIEVYYGARGGTGGVEVRGVRGDKLRIHLGKEGSIPPSTGTGEGTDAGVTESESRGCVEDSGGIGGWSTVSIRVYNEEEEMHRLKAESTSTSTSTPHTSTSTPHTSTSTGMGRSIASYNPSSDVGDEEEVGERYRGVKLGVEGVDEEVEEVADGRVVGFKRRVGGGSAGGMGGTGSGGMGGKKRSLRKREEE